MNRFLLLGVALSASISATGCLPIGGCSAYTGQSDMVYQRGNDMLIVCSNGGYSATLATTATQEGRVNGANLTNGPTGAIITTEVVDQTSGSFSAFGDGTWTYVSLDQTALDHADSLCQDLATRAWWTKTSLPVDTTFARTANGFFSIDDCVAAQTAGTYPADAPCQDQLDLCVDGSSFMTLATGTITGTYVANSGDLEISQFSGASAAFFSNGSLQVRNQAEWTTAAVSPQTVSHCAK